MKREARLESLRRRQDSPAIQTAEDLYEFAKRKFQDSMIIIYVENQKIQPFEQILHSRFEAARQIPGTQGYHQFVPKNDGCSLLAKTSSLSCFSCRYEVLRPANERPANDDDVEMFQEESDIDV